MYKVKDLERGKEMEGGCLLGGVNITNTLLLKSHAKNNNQNLVNNQYMVIFVSKHIRTHFDIQHEQKEKVKRNEYYHRG